MMRATSIDAPGLDPAAVRARLDADGPNELPSQPEPGIASRVVRHLRDPMAILLLAAAAVSGVALGERVDALAIAAIVVLNVVIGVAQEERAAGALAALRSLEVPQARVRRGGRPVVVPARELVRGDIVLLEAGDRVPADADLLNADAFEVDESPLTGESLPVHKDASAEQVADAPLGDRAWAVFAGTLATRGRAAARVSATGPRTVMGTIAAQLGARATRTPLQEELARLSSKLGRLAALVAAAVMGIVLLRGSAPPDEAFLAAVALAVAAVPEGLATVVTIALAMGVRRMAAQGAIVRSLPAVETLGSTTVILADKTGTLTRNKLALGATLQGDGTPEAAEPIRAAIAESAIACNDATLDPPSGDPVEVALLEGFADLLDIRDAIERIASEPFDAEIKLMATLDRIGERTTLHVKGAPEPVTELCTRILLADGTVARLDDATKARSLEVVARLAASGMKTLAMAYREQADGLEVDDLVLAGFVGLHDPLRDSAADTIRRAREAGIDVIMVTGDHPGTAAAVAHRAGIAHADAAVITGTDMRTEIPADPTTTKVYARVEPRQKLELVEHARAAGHIVAVTGDGVNDAPALRAAHIGVAMGHGTDVAREASDLVVTDDDLATIVSAVREGRRIADNIRKVIDYLVAGNISEILVVVGALFLVPSAGVPLLPLQLLWINLLTDGLPALALAVDRVDEGVLLKQRTPGAWLNARNVSVLAGRGAIIAAAALGALLVVHRGLDQPWPVARTAMFTALVIAHLLMAFSARRPHAILPGRASRAHPALWLAIGAGLLAQTVALTVGPVRDLLDMSTVDGGLLSVIAVGGLAPVAVLVAIRAIGGRAVRRRESART